MQLFHPNHQCKPEHRKLAETCCCVQPSAAMSPRGYQETSLIAQSHVHVHQASYQGFWSVSARVEACCAVSWPAPLPRPITSVPSHASTYSMSTYLCMPSRSRERCCPHFPETLQLYPSQPDSCPTESKLRIYQLHLSDYKG